MQKSGILFLEVVLVLLMSLSPVLLAATPSTEADEQSIFRSKTRTVVVINGLEGGEELRVHCKSKDDDLGLKVLKLNESFRFSFRPNFFGTTRFYCGFDWGDGKLHWFDIYIFDRDILCLLCQWVIRKDGPCYYDEVQKKLVLRYPWNPPGMLMP